MLIEYVIGTFSTLYENMEVRIYEAQNPTGLVHSETIPERNSSGVATVGAGHQVSYAFSWAGADNVVHIIELWSAVSVAKLHDWRAQPTINTVTAYTPIRFTIGDGGTNTPAAGQPTCITPELAGLSTDNFIIHRKNVGPLYPTTDFTFTSGTGQWVLTGFDGFAAGEEFTIQITPVVTTTYVNDSVVGKDYGGFVDVTSNRDYLSSDLRKQIRLANTAEYTFPVGASIPIGYPFRFTNYGNYSSPTPVTKVKFLNAPLQWGTTTKTEIELQLYTEAAFVFDGTEWNVCYMTDKRQSSTPGTIIFADSQLIGDVPGPMTDTVYTITHNQNISGDYMVLFSLKGTSASRVQDNDVMATYYDTTANDFKICAQEIFAGAQNLTVTYALVRL